MALLRAIFSDPYSLDPARRAARVTREIAAHVALLARELERSGHEPKRVAQFLMRCLFTMFAEDVDLLKGRPFTEALEEHWIHQPEAFAGEVEELWRRMDVGGPLWRSGNRVPQFNGGLFADPRALPLDRAQLRILIEAAKADWADVEPAIFGTLLERALDPKERHRLGAHYTPRSYVERLVRPTIEEPLREEWDLARAQVQALLAAADPAKNDREVNEARAIVQAFYDRLTRYRVLDPACGSGNFLYVALDVFKRIESEVLDYLTELGDSRPMFSASGRTVTPGQFLGIEVKEWAKEIAELVLWIGYLQWQIRNPGIRAQPPEPILRRFENIAHRDAVLEYDEKVPLLGDDGDPVTRWDGKTMKEHPSTGDDVPDETACVPVYRYVNPRKAEWPEAEFIVGNPPFIGNSRMRSALGDGYAEALRLAYTDLPESIDYVMYWWDIAAERARKGRVRQFGLITTNTVSQAFARRVIQKHLDAEQPLSIVFAVPDHPWVDSVDGADVRIAMTSGVAGRSEGRQLSVVDESSTVDGITGVELRACHGRINADLSVGVDLTRSIALASNRDLSNRGVSLFGLGFLVTRDEAVHLGLNTIPALDRHIRPYRNGRDVTAVSRDLWVIDLYGLEIDDVLARFPEVYQWVSERVKPEREQNRRDGRRARWWIFGEPNPKLRLMLRGLHRYIATTETAKHRTFVFLPSAVLPDNMLVNIAFDDAFFLGVLSSRIHVTWAVAAGGRLGVGNDPRYNKTRCFDPFPFPDPDEFTKQRIRNLGEQLDAHRKRQQEQHPDLTITGMYNVLEKLRSGHALTAKEKKIHEAGLVTVLKQIHDDLDAAVFDAYAWPRNLSDEQILERLVALNAERAAEERRGLVRWLRPEFQNPAGTAAASQTRIEIEAPVPAEAAAARELPPWPKTLRDQVSAVRNLFIASQRGRASWTAEEVARAFRGARRAEVASVVEALASLGILLSFDTVSGRQWRAAS
ncbi:MAG TPA: DNA methyltransferase [Thermoanaerobaculia bacterium]